MQFLKDAVQTVGWLVIPYSTGRHRFFRPRISVVMLSTEVPQSSYPLEMRVHLLWGLQCKLNALDLHIYRKFVSTNYQEECE